MGTIANILGFGNAAGPHYQLDYSTATGAGITSATQATLASSNGISNICYLDTASTMVMLRADVDTDPIASNGYPRSEWREKATDGTTDRAFNRETGDHKTEVWVLPTHLPPEKPSFVLLQNHDANRDVLEIAVQPRSDFATSGKMEVVLRIDSDGNGSTSAGIPRFVADYGTVSELATNPKPLYAWARCGLIAPGSVRGWQASVNGVLIQSWDAGMPNMFSTGASGSYWKSGMYLQTKWTGSGTGGLEGDRNEYGEAGWKTFKTYHNGESAPFQPSAGTDVTANPTVGSPRWGVQAKASGAGSGTNITPAFPTSTNAPVAGELVFAVVRAYRSSGSSVVATPTCSTTGWLRATPQWPPSGSVYADVGLVAHTLRYQFWVAEFSAGLSAPTFVTAGGNDTLHGIVAAVDNAQLARVEQGGDVGIAVTATTTTMGPAPALAASVPIGSLILAFLDHEYTKASGSIATITGDSLTWNEAEENIATWAHITDWAINASAVTPGAKSLTGNTFATSGKGIGEQIAIRARNRRSNLIVAA